MPSGDNPAPQPIRILLADDHTLMRTALRILLEKEPGFSIVGEAQDGQQTVSLSISEHPDVVLVDIDMPKLNGLDAARQIVRRNPKIAVIMLSGSALEASVARAAEVGARAYVLKDSADEHLIRTIREICGKKPGEPAAPESATPETESGPDPNSPA